MSQPPAHWEQCNSTRGDPGQHPLAHAEAGKAAVYVIGSFVGDSTAEPTVKGGMDGAWVGAVRGSSCIFASIEPGDHLQ